MSFWASSYSFQSESLRQRMLFVQSGPVLRVSLYGICKENPRDVPRFVILSIESF
jgi:hypothetical protein